MLLHLHDIGTCRAAERHDVGNGVAAQTVGAVNATRDFTGSVQTRNDLAVDVNDLSVDIDLDAAHRVVNGRHLLAGVPRTFREGCISLVVGLKAQRILHFALDDLVVVVNTCLELVGIHAGLLGKFLKRIGFDD